MDPVEKIFDQVQSSIANDRHLGIQLYASLDGEVLIDAAFGEAAPGVPLSRTDAVPWICSTKLLGAVAMSALMVRHGVKPTSMVAEFVPEYGRLGKHEVTIGQLMSHTVPYAVENENASYSKDHVTALAAVCSMPIAAAGGSRAHYSAIASWVVVAEMVSRLSGEAFEDHVRRSVLEPLEMSHTVFGAPSSGGEDRPDLLPLYEWTSDDPSAELKPVSFWPGHPSVGAHGPAAELGRVLECLVSGGRWRGREVISPEAADLMTTTCRSDLADPYFMGLDVAWGMGACVDPLLLGAPSKARVVGHTGSNCQIAVGDRDQRLVVCHMATNEAFESVGPRRLESRVVRELFKLTAGS
ncbi:serine hydrolase domain-containing protein [Streptomyces sp. GZWMJZ-114]|uniref:serine hydrolase domain-containing protein n=1 Tax=Streptomyces sp. GZWMJZ-114 TaxID=2494734 RepID=UPI001011EA19|nr:serine hydrolase domain-containing protein [Streptomyces sp. GZWMJZ-114]